MSQPPVTDTSLKGLAAALLALQEWRDKAADPALRNIDGFAVQMGMAMKDVVRRVEKLTAKLEALAAIGGLAWQSGWLPMPDEPKSGPPVGPSGKRDVSWMRPDARPATSEEISELAGRGGLYL